VALHGRMILVMAICIATTRTKRSQLIPATYNYSTRDGHQALVETTAAFPTDRAS
jgi:hypothetical protein